MDFPSSSLKGTANLWKFREQRVDETEEEFRLALHEHVKPKDRIESFEILFGVGWDKWNPDQNRQSLFG
jgi:hypothetical protein